MPTATTKYSAGSWLFALALLACSSEDKGGSNAGTDGLTGTGAVGTGGVAGLGGSSGGATIGGSPTGGAVATGGAMPTGGVTATGGVTTGGGGTTGGLATGGAGATGGATDSGGSEVGGTASGGGDSGGSGTGGDVVAGASGSGGGGVGGTETGGSEAGGAETGGEAGGPAGGAETGGAETGGTTFAGCTPGRLDATATCNTPDAFTGAPGAAVSCVGELDGRYGSIYATIDGQQYFLQVNEWGSSGAQTMAHGGDYFYRMAVQNASVASNGAPTGYPSMFIGSNNGHETTGNNLPIAISNITSVSTTWIWTDNGAIADETSNVFNAAYDVWFNENTSQSTEYGPTAGFLMVWLYKPLNAEPIGGEPAIEDVTIEGVDGTWDIWIGLNGSTPCISYVRTERTYELSFDLKHFIDDAITRQGGLQASWALTNIFTGFEIWTGSKDVQTTAFCAFVE
ncbi:MAG: hypothetical protein JW751_03550 [Polyangiaceae bacterium]|nr:hypothetical protein [Polyangiaceae bacterium]